jgi:hypothetical protein
MIKSAILSDCRKYRYSLSRIWDNSKPYVLVIGLNPSTADENVDDRTVKKCENYAKNWGFGGLKVVNLFAFRATLPVDMMRADNPVGFDNDRYIKELSKDAALTIVAWGNDGSYLGRDNEVLKLIKNPMCININTTGQPSHPLFQKKELKSRPYLV